MVARRVRWLVVAVAALVGLAGLVRLIVFFLRMGIHGAEALAGFLSLVLAYLVAMVTLLVWIGRRLTTSALDEDALVGQLLREVRQQWAEEITIRQLRRPQPLRMRVRPTLRAVVASWPGPSGSRTGLAGLRRSMVLGDDEPHPARVLAEAFRDDPCQLLVILGEEGAGKTTLAILFTSAMVDVSSDGAVPVLLSVAG